MAQGAFCPNREERLEMDGEFEHQLDENRKKICGQPKCLREGIISRDQKIPEDREREQPFRTSEDGTEWEVITCDTCGEG